jgi:hypothetical protein
MDEIQVVASYIFAGIFNLECLLKLLALGKYYFWESHNIFDFSLIIGTNLGIILTLAFPNFSIGPLATLLRAFRIGRVLRLVNNILKISSIVKRKKVIEDASRYYLLYFSDSNKHRSLYVIVNL